MCAKCGANRFSRLVVFPDFCCFDPLHPPNAPYVARVVAVYEYKLTFRHPLVRWTCPLVTAHSQARNTSALFALLMRNNVHLPKKTGQCFVVAPFYGLIAHSATYLIKKKNLNPIVDAPESWIKWNVSKYLFNVALTLGSMNSTMIFFGDFNVPLNSLCFKFQLC